ncbi:protein PTST homolog 2, chloroplastic [Tanacetum coccineum]
MLVGESGGGASGKCSGHYPITTYPTDGGGHLVIAYPKDGGGVAARTELEREVTSSNLVSSHGFGTNVKVKTSTMLVLVKKDLFFGLKEVKGTRSVVFCKGLLESEAEMVLEREIVRFMEMSNRPNEFPSRKELLDGGRSDLVDAIVKKGGWMAFGWDVEDDGYLSCCSSSNQVASLSGRSVETGIQEDAGIEGMLHRLEKHRSLTFGISKQDNGNCIDVLSKANDGHNGYALPDVAAAETSRVEMPKDIKSQLQQMQLELSSALCLLRSKSETPNPEGHKSSSNKLHQLSDTWEFQENEIMNAKDRLRSIRGELVVLEGKMTLSINEAQKMVKAKQRGVDTGSITLHLHTTYIFWPNSALEVFLAGSFDGWTAQRKMKRSQTGVFSLSLKLYPGRYEIKFIVDGVWRVDPLRPIVSHDGYENNLVIIYE